MIFSDTLEFNFLINSISVSFHTFYNILQPLPISITTLFQQCIRLFLNFTQFAPTEVSDIILKTLKYNLMTN
jgi:hypothetical protein